MDDDLQQSEENKESTPGNVTPLHERQPFLENAIYEKEQKQLESNQGPADFTNAVETRSRSMSERPVDSSRFQKKSHLYDQHLRNIGRRLTHMHD